MTLRLRAPIVERMSEHVRRAYPEEGCGVLLGREAGGSREVEEAIVFENQCEDSRQNRYLISPEQFLAAEKGARARRLDVIGIFHSHPDHPARPSSYDLEHAWPYYSYVIVSVEEGRIGEIRCWRLADDRSALEAEPLEIRSETDTLAMDGEDR